MRTTRPRPIRRGILGGIFTLVGLAIVAGAILGVTLGRAVDEISHRVEYADELAAEVAQLRAALLDQQTGLRGYQLTGEDSVLQPYRVGLRNEQGALDTLIADADHAALRSAAREVSRAAEAWRASWVLPQLELIAAGDFEATRQAEATGVGGRLFDEVRGALGRLDLAIGEVRSSAIAAFADTARFVDVVILVAVLGYGAVLAFGAFWVVSRIERPLDELVHTAEAMERDEPVRFVARRADEIGTLAETFERLQRTAQHRYRTVSALAEQSTVLNRFSELVNYAEDEDAVVCAGRAALERLVPSRGGEVLLANPSFDQLRLHSAWGETSRPPDRPLSVDRPNACPGIRRNAVHLTRSAGDPFSLACDVHPLEAGSLLCVPMVSHNHVIGVIHLEREEEDGFDDDAIQTAGRIAEQVALAMANLRLMQRMERQAMTDPLTGLANPRSFDPLVERELAISRREGQPAAVVMLDLDHFKQFNDAHGHPAGDEALRAFARTMRAALRESDVAARYGGEEFAILLRNTDLAGAMVVAEKVRTAIEVTPIEIGPNRFARVTASLGVAASDRHGLDRMQLMRLADGALYAAKAAGRNRIAAAPVPERTHSDERAPAKPTSIQRAPSARRSARG